MHHLKKLIWFLNDQYKNNQINAIAIVLINNEGHSFSSYDFHCNGKDNNSGLFALIGAVECLKDRLVRNGEPDLQSVVDVLVDQGILSTPKNEE